MKLNITKEVATMEAMTVGQLQTRYVEVFGEAVRSRHKHYLIRRIAWRLQADAEGGLSERALRRAEELARNADVRVTPPRGTASGVGGVSTATVRVSNTDSRLPSPGAQITRKYKGRKIVVTVNSDGFDYLGEKYKSLSSIAKAITGSHMNGFRFFGLERGA